MLSYLLFPAFVLGITGIAVAGASIEGVNEGLVLGMVLPLTYLAIALLERRLPYRREWNEPQGDVRTDVLHLLLSGIGMSQVFQATLYVAALWAAAELSSRFGVSLWPLHWPLLAQLFLALLIAELGHYWFHRWSHEVALVWRVHAPHHSAPRLYWLNATRFHPLDLFALIAFQTVPLILLGADKRALFLYAVFTGAYGQLQHCNVEVKTGLLRWLFATPEVHRWHHAVDARQGNHNYGAVLSVWDWIFGTYYYPGHFVGPVGIGDMPDYPRSWTAQLLAPFRKPGTPIS